MHNNLQINNKEIGLRIRQKREELKLSRESFAEILGLSDYYIGQLERGERQMSLPVLVKISNCLHISLDFVVFGQDQANSINDPSIKYDISNDKLKEINNLLEKCSLNELELFNKLIRTVIPHLTKN